MKKYDIFITLSFKIEDDYHHSTREKVVRMVWADSRKEALEFTKVNIKEACDKLIEVIDYNLLVHVNPEVKTQG